MAFTVVHENRQKQLQAAIVNMQMEVAAYDAAKSFNMSPTEFLNVERNKRYMESEVFEKVFAKLRKLGCTVTNEGGDPQHPYAFSVEDYHGTIKVSYTVAGVTMNADIKPYAWDVDETYAQRREGFVFRLESDSWEVDKVNGPRYELLSAIADKEIMWGKFSAQRYMKAVRVFVTGLESFK